MLFCFKLVLSTLISFSFFFHFIKSITLFISSLIAVILYTPEMMVNLHSNPQIDWFQFCIVSNYSFHFSWKKNHFAFELKYWFFSSLFRYFISYSLFIYAVFFCRIFVIASVIKTTNHFKPETTTTKEKKTIKKIWFFIVMNIRSQQTCWNTKQFFFIDLWQ